MTGAVAAVDLGATSGRVIVGRVGRHVLDTTTVARFPNDPVHLPDGLHWNLVGLYGQVLAGLRTALRDAPDLAGIGVDSWAVDYGLVGGGRLLGTPYHYRDDRTVRGVEAVHVIAPHAELFARNGLQFLPFNTLYQLAVEDAALLELADHALLVPDLIGYWLTGAVRTERTNASTTGLLRAGRAEWDAELMARLGIDRRLLAPLIEPGEPLGPLRGDVRALVGASDGVTVTAVGSHDTASAVVAVPMTDGHAAYISCGTWGLVGVEVDRPVLTDTAREAGFTNEGGVDGRTRLLRNVMGLWMLSETVRGWEREGDRIDLPDLLRAAEAVTDEVPLLDVDDPRFLAPGDMPARIDAWCDEHGLAAPRSRPAYARSIVESLAQAFADAALEAARVGRVDVRVIHIVGGGALNELLCRRIADRSGLPVLAGPVEATALGNILVQARSAGLVSGTLEALRDLVTRTHSPRRYAPRA
ncbi:rhamnulokinase [Microbacterium sp. GXF7504]